jgi:IS605 OrfB family transposase
VGLKPKLLNPRTTFVAVHARLTFTSPEDERAVLDLMRRFSAAYRWIYRRLLEGHDPNELKREGGPMERRFGLNVKYNEGARDLALWKIGAMEELGQPPDKVVFGGKGLFRRLGKKGDLKARLEAKRLWRERRNGLLYSPGDRSQYSGNRNLQLFTRDGALWLRIVLDTTPLTPEERGRSRLFPGESGRTKGRYVDALVQTRSQDLSAILEVVGQKGVAPIGVNLRLNDGKVYAFFSRQLALPVPVYTRQRGVLGVDVNARPFHLALAVVGPDGNLRRYTAVSLEEADRIRERKRGEASGNALENFYWHVAHQVVRLAKEEGVAIAIENIQRLPKGRRGDGNKYFRRKLHRFAYRAILERIVRVASREGVEVWGVNPAYTSVIGALKYAPMRGLTKDVAAAWVIARRAMEFGERVPKRYLELLALPEYREAVLSWFHHELLALEQKMGGERNEYKLNRLKAEKEDLEKALGYLKKFLSLQGSSEGPKREVTARRNPEEPKGDGLPLWRALQVGVLRPLLGRKVLRDLSALKPLLVGGAWNGGGGVRLGPVRYAGPARMGYLLETPVPIG